ncbi:hypothetical protein QSJ18_18270 [Gordonia sp. ABSL1-1]|uniref:hypothetical protein n=1 Tax=Gordonia sp. ABSL1-1 TaxID=3053923 RepID=UPI002572EB32|nr:hypothetical protein [Gordonia sp. ABSL1-1]MDL9938696.1 hypothetical protein [Gordonia sp. ABSL1-1]
MTDGYLTRAEIDHLADQLAKLPGLETELAVAVTGSRRGDSVRRSVPKSRPPYSIEMQTLIDDLGATVVAVIRDLCEQRDLSYEGGQSITAMGRWLTDHRFGLQLIESGVESFHDLCTIIERCERALSWSHMDAPLAAEDRAKAEDARVSLATVEVVARKVGEPDLTRGRLRRLIAQSRVQPLDTARNGDVEVKLYRFGDILAAHRDMPRSDG